MWKQRAVTLCASFAVLPLLVGCATGAGGPWQAYGPPPLVAAVANNGGAQVYRAGPGGPVAVLVMLPGHGDVLTENPQLWTAQGFDVVAPPPSEIYRIAADQEAAAAQLIAQAQAIADAPIWLIGANPAIEAAMASIPAGGSRSVSGVVVTSTNSGVGTCSEEMIYSYSGSGQPKVSVKKSGNACPSGSPFAAPNSTVAPNVPTLLQPHAPHLIEASLPHSAATPSARRHMVRQVAELIRSTPQS